MNPVALAEPPAEADLRRRSSSGTAIILRVAALLYAFLLGIHALGEGFTLLGSDLLGSFFRATENPFFGLIVGILSTSIVQSSSLTTSLIVGLVAAPENPLPLANAVPMVMGANFGTTGTNTIVALAHITRKDEFKRAFAVSTCDDFFNFFAVVILLPLEIATGYLRKSAQALATIFTPGSGVAFESPIKQALEFGYVPLDTAAAAVAGDEIAHGAAVIAASFALIFFALISLVKIMRRELESKAERFILKAFRRSALTAIFLGMLATVMVQSSSIVTSLLVPFAGAGLLTLGRAYPVVLGANIGTTVTALMAAAAVSGANAVFGIAVALVHLVFNVTATVLLYPIPVIRDIPLECSRRLADVGVRSPSTAILYVVFLFYGVPAVFAALNHFFWNQSL